MKTLKTKLFTHNDLDGVGCAIVALLQHDKDDIDIEYCGYSNINDKIKTFINSDEFKEYFNIYITDISVDEDTAELLDKANKTDHDVKLFDHHKTALALNKYEWATIRIVDVNNKLTCGTELFYNSFDEFIKTKEQVEFVESVRSYDTWDWTKTGNQLAKDLHDIYDIMGLDFVDYYSHKLQLDRYSIEFEISKEHKLLLEYKRKEIEKYIGFKLGQVKVIQDKLGNNVAIVTADSNLSELGMRILNEYTTVEISYVAMFTGTGYSLRSKDEFDVSEIAKEFGGGGHKNAAGFNIDYEKVHELIL